MQATSSKIDARRYWRSSSFKVAMLFTVLLGICVGVLSYFSYYFNNENFVIGAEKVIDTEIGYLGHNDPAELQKRIAEIGYTSSRIYLLRDAGGNFIAGNIREVPEDVRVLREGVVLFNKDRKTFAAKIHIFEDGRTLLVGFDVTEGLKSYRNMQWLSLLSIASMTIVIIVSFLISTFVVSRTNRIAVTAKNIMDTGDLSQRIALDSRWDDLGNMAFILNAFLERVERLMVGIRQVSDNIAHDLRTPLTRLYNNAEMLKAHPSFVGNEEISTLCEGMVTETSRLLTAFNGLLRIARIEAGSQRQNFQPVELRQILKDVIDLYEPLAEQKGIRITDNLKEPAPFTGDRDLLFQAFVNILDNSVKYTPAGGRILVGLERSEFRSIVSLQDSGPGIDDADKSKVFDRFYRADASRSTEGNGLGLALVAAVIALHEGEITLHDAKPGLMIKVTL